MDTGVLGQWADEMAARGCAPGTVRLRLHYLDLLQRHGADLLTATQRDLVAFLAHPSWRPETRHSALASLRVFYRWAARAGLRPDDPTAGMASVPVPAGVPSPIPDRDLLAALRRAGPATALVLLLGGWAGLRRAEIARVRSDDVTDFGLRVLGKGGKVRLVPVHDRLAGPLSEVDGWAFPSSVRDGPVGPDWVSARCERSIGPRWSCHSLRHRFATAVYRATGDLLVTQHLLGHAKAETTSRYVLLPAERMRAAVAVVA